LSVEVIKPQTEYLWCV